MEQGRVKFYVLGCLGATNTVTIRNFSMMWMCFVVLQAKSNHPIQSVGFQKTPHQFPVKVNMPGQRKIALQPSVC